MAKNSIDVYGSTGKTNILTFLPEQLHLVTDPEHPLFDERVFLPLDEAMVLNIKEFGVLQSILVWKDPESGKTLVVAGRQRVKHTQEANRRLAAEGKPPLLVPAVPRRGRTAHQVAAGMVSENELRQPDTPLGRANKMAFMLNQGRSESELALIFGCGPATVRDTLAILDCTAVVKNALEAGDITLTHVKTLVKMQPDEQRAKVAELVEAGKGATPHERSRKQAAVMGERPRVKSRKQILAALAQAQGEYAAALRWVLGEEQGTSAC
ncbi:hypothetical protein C1I89_22395 [Achromobacter pulmonis]|uniref:ParB/Spo0J HTH domain-containing protein n=1 Tax=Achromobacter pulmonis TaxID=1389932 RepID=A0A2N8KDS1_9BURK|nr:hypothetical protein [Achromobacter pulmonis]PND31587.1 hypothetical protein C1I89_22395 [Achromobacter pulmonis]